VNAFWTYAPADGIITQINLNSSGTPIDPSGIGLDQVNNDSKSFIADALTNGALNSTLRGPVLLPRNPRVNESNHFAGFRKTDS